MNYCGIDIAKYYHEGSVIDEAGKVLFDSKEGCEKLLTLFERLNISKEELLIGMESTGHYRLNVYACLPEAGYEVKVMQSGEFSGTRQKIFKRDSPYRRCAIRLAASWLPVQPKDKKVSNNIEHYRQ